MITSPNLGLKIWNLTTDKYDHAQQADNWAKVDEHDHSGNKGVQIPTAGIKDGAITSSKLDPAAIPSLTLADLSVTTAKLADGSVTNAKLATNSVQTTNIVDGTIASADLATNSVTTIKIAANAVDSTKLASDGAVDGNRAVQTNHIRDNQVTADKLSSQVATYSGISQTSNARRGKLSIVTNETWAGTPGTFSSLPTADTITTQVVPTDGLIHIFYRALWKLTGASNPATVTVFVGANQATVPAGDLATAAVTSTNLPVTGVKYGTLITAGASTGFIVVASTTTDTGIDTSKPIYWNGWRSISFEIDAGTYDVAIKYQTAAASGGTLQVKNRKLWVRTEGY
jgi:hypothetical protein